jgi:hypothetical protein
MEENDGGYRYPAGSERKKGKKTDVCDGSFWHPPEVINISDQLLKSMNSKKDLAFDLVIERIQLATTVAWRGRSWLSLY